MVKEKADNPRSMAAGYRLCVCASGSVITDVIKLITLISVSCLHFGQKRGEFFRIVSSRIFNRVLLEQTGQRIHSFVSNKALPPKLHAMQSVV